VRSFLGDKNTTNPTVKFYQGKRPNILRPNPKPHGTKFKNSINWSQIKLQEIVSVEEYNTFIEESPEFRQTVAPKEENLITSRKTLSPTGTDIERPSTSSPKNETGDPKIEEDTAPKRSQREQKRLEIKVGQYWAKKTGKRAVKLTEKTKQRLIHELDEKLRTHNQNILKAAAIRGDFRRAKERFDQVLSELKAQRTEIQARLAQIRGESPEL